MTTPRPAQHFEATLGVAAEAVGGTCTGTATLPLRAVTTDSRDVPEDALFVALAGERFDGHDFLDDAAAAGARAAMVHTEGPITLPCIRVDDTLVGLGRLARWHRDHFDIPVVAITGSAGKSTTKEMVAAVLSARFNVLKTTGNLNNRIGVPLTLFALGREHTAAVIEAGISLPGEMAHLAETIRPTVRIVLNAALSHVEFLTDATRVAAEKARLFDGAAPSDVLIYNADDPLVAAEAQRRTTGSQVSFGLESGDVHPSEIHVTPEACGLIVHDQQVIVPAPGMHNVRNALAAIAAGLAVGLTMEEIAPALETRYQPMAMRSRSIQLGDVRLIDDTYNSNPASADAALELLTSYRAGRTIAVLADMLELGDAAVAAHAAVGTRAGELGVDLLLTLGPLSQHTQTAARAVGVDGTHFDDQEACSAHLLGLLEAGDVVLVKGSRGMRMENVVEAIKGRNNP